MQTPNSHTELKPENIMTQEIITGEKVYIRPITYDDTSMIVKWRNADNVRQYFIYRADFTKESHEKWMKEQVETGKVAQFIVCDVKDDKPIGCTYLRDISKEDKSAEYGVFIGEEEYRGKGIGKEALKLTLKVAFEELELEKVISRAISSNKPSVYSFLNSGFKITEETVQTTFPDGVEVPVTMMEIRA